MTRQKAIEKIEHLYDMTVLLNSMYPEDVSLHDDIMALLMAADALKEKGGDAYE